MAKKGNNEGSIYKDKTGKWRGAVTLYTADGKPKRKYFYGKTKREVTEKVNKVLNELRTNTYIEPSKVTLYQWLCTSEPQHLLFNDISLFFKLYFSKRRIYATVQKDSVYLIKRNLNLTA